MIERLPDVVVIDTFGQDWVIAQHQYSRFSAVTRRTITAYSLLTPPEDT